MTPFENTVSQRSADNVGYPSRYSYFPVQNFSKEVDYNSYRKLLLNLRRQNAPLLVSSIGCLAWQRLRISSSWKIGSFALSRILIVEQICLPVRRRDAFTINSGLEFCLYGLPVGDVYVAKQFLENWARLCRSTFGSFSHSRDTFPVLQFRIFALLDIPF